MYINSMKTTHKVCEIINIKKELVYKIINLFLWSRESAIRKTHESLFAQQSKARVSKEGGGIM